jgi:uncharacterized protein (DUF779 family)
MSQDQLSRVAVTAAAAELLRNLRDLHGPLMFHQSGGCCDGSSPMCYPAGEFLTGDADVRLGELLIGESGSAADVVPVWMSRSQFEYWRHTHLTIDVVPGRGAGFSLEAPTGQRFLIRSRLLTDAELAAFEPGVMPA